MFNDCQLLWLVQVAALIFATLDVVVGSNSAASYQEVHCPSKTHRAGILCFIVHAPVYSIHSAAFKKIPEVNLGFSARRHLRLSIKCEAMSTFSLARQGAEMGSYCTTCYALQGSGHKFCVSCGAPQLTGGGIFRHWSTEEARAKQFTNTGIGVSSCGPASVLTALSMIGSLHCTSRTPCTQPTFPTPSLPSHCARTPGVIEKRSVESAVLLEELQRLLRPRACDVAGTRCRHNFLALSDPPCPVSLRDHLVGRSGPAPLLFAPRRAAPQAPHRDPSGFAPGDAS